MSSLPANSDREFWLFRQIFQLTITVREKEETRACKNLWNINVFGPILMYCLSILSYTACWELSASKGKWIDDSQGIFSVLLGCFLQRVVMDRSSMHSREATLTQTSDAMALRVLLTEEQHSFSHVLATNITNWGYEVVVLPSLAALHASEIEGDVLLLDLDECPKQNKLLNEHQNYPRETPYWGKSLQEQDNLMYCGRLHARLMIVLSSWSISRGTLEQMGAIACLHKPFEMGQLQRYLRVLQQLLYSSKMDSPSECACQECTTLELRGRQARILVADDAVELVEAIRLCLINEAGYEVVVAYDGIEALEQYVIWQPQCIITDLIMPWMNGYQVMRCLTSCSQNLMPAFVVMSALTQLEFPVHRSYLHDKAVVFVDKPFHIEHLLNAVEQALALYSEKYGLN